MITGSGFGLGRGLLLAAVVGAFQIAALAQVTISDDLMFLPSAGATDGGEFLTHGTSVAVDAAGGVHVVYLATAGDRPVFYAYCATDCARDSNWRYTTVIGQAYHANLALDSKGRPRILLVTFASEPPDSLYQYALCDGDCTNRGNWKITPVVRNRDVLAGDSRSFALDRQDRPRFLYKSQDPKPYDIARVGTFYVFCDTACASAENWFQVKLGDDILNNPSLALTAAGEPRIAFDVFISPEKGPPVWFLGYLECDTYCKSGSLMLLLERGAFATYTLQLDSADHPRLAFFSGNRVEGNPLQPGQLYYFRCNRACANQDQNEWQVSDLGLSEGVGQYVDLALDRQNQPHLAYAISLAGLGYSRCTANCDLGNATWEHRRFPLAEELNKTLFLDVNRCSFGSWMAGEFPSLALDAAGNPRMGVDVKHGSMGVDDRNLPCRAITEIRRAAITVFNH